MSTDADERTRPVDLDPPEAGVLAVVVVLLILYVVGLAGVPEVLAIAGPITGLFAVAVTVLWVGEWL